MGPLLLKAIGFFACVLCYANASDWKCVNKTFKLDRFGKDESAISRMVEAVNANGGGDVVFPANQVYEVEIEDDYSSGHTAYAQKASVVFGFYGCKRVNVDMNGSTIVLKGNHSTKYSLFFFSNCKQFSLKNGTLIGDVIDHDYSPVCFGGQEEKSSHQWGYGIHISGSAGHISSMKISLMVGDGIYVSSYKNKSGVTHAKLTISDCEISFCRRNGITVASNIGLSISNTRIHHIGTHNGINGASPQAGIDLEYEDGVWDKGEIKLINCSINNCTEKTIAASNTSPPNPVSLVITNSSFEGSEFQITKVRSDNVKLVKHCTFKNTPFFFGEAVVEDCVFDLGTTLSYIHGTTFNNCEFKGALDTKESTYGCCLVGNTTNPARFRSCTFRSIRGRNDNSGFQGFSGFYFPLVAYFSKCVFQNCSFVIGNPKHDSVFDFNNCTLSDGCLIQNRGEKTIHFSKSKLNNVASYSNQKGRFAFNKCDIIQDDATIPFPLVYYGHHIVYDSRIINKLSISPEMRNRGIKSVLIEESK